MPHFPKPAEGSWTEHYPQLGTGPDLVRGLDLARALRARARGDLRVGRGSTSVGSSSCPAVGQLLHQGDRRRPHVDRRGPRRRRRGARLPQHVPSPRATSSCGRTIPSEETAGVCRQFQCKYHGWRYSLEGDLTFVQQEDEFFDLDKADYGLAPVQVDVWEGFIFVNLDADQHRRRCATTSASSPQGLEGYPFGEMTQVYKYRADVHSNWKLYIDAFAEFYHAPVLHAKQYVSDESSKLIGLRLRGPPLRARRSPRDGVVVGRHGPAQGPEHGQAHRADPAQRQLRRLGPPRHPRTRSAPARAQPVAQPDVGPRLVRVLPQLHGAGLGDRAGTSPTTTGRSPTTATSSKARCTSRRRRPRATACARRWLRSRSRSSGCRTATRSKPPRPMLESRAVSEFPLRRPGDPPPPPPPHRRRVRAVQTRRYRTRRGG